MWFKKDKRWDEEEAWAKVATAWYSLSHTYWCDWHINSDCDCGYGTLTEVLIDRSRHKTGSGDERREGGRLANR